MMQFTNRQFIALSLVLLCLVAVILGIFNLSRREESNKAVLVDDGGGKRESILKSRGSHLAYISLDGMIMEGAEDNSMFAQESSAVKARKLLYMAASDNAIKGVLLRINSPGGTVGMSQELYNAVLAVRKKKPVVVSMGDLAASGGYYTASAADKIVANPGTLTASIGVILQSMNLQGLLTDKLGVKAVTIKSGKFKDILSPYRPSTGPELALLQNIIDKSYHQFLRAVLEGRTKDMTDANQKALRMQQITAIADGRVVLGEDALNVGLVDALGGLEEAKGILQDLAAKRFNLKKADKLPLEDYDTPFSLRQLFNLAAASPIHFPQAASVTPNLKDLMPASMRYTNQPLWLMESAQ